MPSNPKAHFVPEKNPLHTFLIQYVGISFFIVSVFLHAPLPAYAQGTFEVEEFVPYRNIPRGRIVTDPSNFTSYGMVLPNEKQAPGGIFDYEITVKNTSTDTTRFYYQVFYEWQPFDVKGLFEKHFSSAGFFGLCNESGEDFFLSEPVYPGKKAVINKPYRIIYPQGSGACGLNPLPESVNSIRKQEEWMNTIRTKAAKNRINEEKQLYLDAVWMANRALEKKQDSTLSCQILPEGSIRFFVVVFSEKDYDTLAPLLKTCMLGVRSGEKNPFVAFSELHNTTVFGGASLLSVDLLHGKEILARGNLPLPPIPDSLVLTTDKSSHAKNHILQDLIVLKGKNFYRKGKPFFPLTINYMVSMQTDGKNVWPCPIEYFSKQDPSFPLNRSSCLANLAADMQLIKSMGFNSVRITTIGEIHKQRKSNRLFIKPCITQSKDTVMFLADNNNYQAYFSAVEELLDICYGEGLKVVFLLRNGMGDGARDKHLARITSAFSDHPGIMAWDLFNEPLYFDTIFHDKPSVINAVKSWQALVKKNAPHHLTTIGMEGIREVFEWDPNLMDVDFISFHPYEYEPEQVRNEISWYGKYIRKPWVIGETSLPADNGKVSYVIQKSFAEKTLSQAIACGASGYSWWQFKDVDWKTYHAKYMGVLQLQGLTRLNDGRLVNGKAKPVGNVFKSFSLSSYGGSNCELLPNYFNYSVNEKPRLSTLSGRIVNEKNEGLEGGVVMAWNHEHTRMFHTITRKDGSFELVAPFIFVHWIASVTGYTTQEGWIALDKKNKTLTKTLPLLRLSFVEGK